MVVVPHSADGHVGAVVVRPRGGGAPVVVDRAYVTTDISADGSVTTTEVAPRSLRADFAEARASLPKPPLAFRVFFIEGTDTLQPEAAKSLDAVARAIKSRAAPEVIVIGHTDFVGSHEYNDRLSLQRAHTVRDLLVRRGVSPDLIQTAGRGKREPIVDTTAAELQNRRVEIIVR